VLSAGSQSAWAVVLHSGNGNTDAASLAAPAVGGPAVSEFGFNNVGKSSTDGGAVTYLGNRWVLAAGHTTIGSIHGQVKFGGIGYTIDDSTITYLHNPDNSLADLQLFQITTDPGLPSITPQLVSTSAQTAGTRQIMIGNGFNNGDQLYWDIDESQDPDDWSITTAPGEASGFDVVGSHVVRWGENEVHQTGLAYITFNHSTYGFLGVLGFSTRFDDELYTGVMPLDSEAQVTGGDSGGAVLAFDDGVWKLSGIMISIETIFDGQPFVTAGTPYTVFGNTTLIADISVYRDEILSIVPEPSSVALAATGGLAVALAGLRRWRRRLSR
jgi:hypothetical protein